MPLKGPPFVGLEDALKGAVVDGTAQGQHVVGLFEIPQRSGALQPHMPDTLVGRLDAPTADGIAAVAGSAVVQSLGTIPQKADQLPDLLGGVVIARGFGYAAPAWVGLGLGAVGFGLALTSFALDDRTARTATPDETVPAAMV